MFLILIVDRRPEATRSTSGLLSRLEQQLVDVRAGGVHLRSGLQQRLQRLNPIAVRRAQTRQIQPQRRAGRLASRFYIGHAAARQLPLDSNEGECLRHCGGNSDSQSSVPPKRGSKSPDSSHAGIAKPMPESPAWARCSNHWIDNAFLSDASPQPWPGCEISAGSHPNV